MLRPRGAASMSSNNTKSLALTSSPDLPYRSSTSASKFKGQTTITNTNTNTVLCVRNIPRLLILLFVFTLGMVVQNYFHAIIYTVEPSLLQQSNNGLLPLVQQSKSKSQSQSRSLVIPPALLPEFDGLIRRAQLHQGHCQRIGLVAKEDHAGVRVNNHTAHLSQFGILDAVQNYNYDLDSNNNNKYPKCQLPPDSECGETQFTVIFMAYNPERLQKLHKQIVNMVGPDSEFSPLVKEVIVVWNGERQVDETKLGQKLVDLGATLLLPVRISYPLKAGFPNDLMNRYHPRLEVSTKAIMYYDDDGPFYSYKATLGGFELWKRNSNAQIGAMARKLDLNQRQQDEKRAVLNGVGDRFFISHCPTDALRYNFNEFANFGANMVLPSGSFLHSNYLCFLWHPLFQDIRNYVQQHPVNPDDGTVSVIVSQLSGRAPKVYSRRINESTETRRRRRRRLSLLEDTEEDNKDDDDDNVRVLVKQEDDLSSSSHRRLMDGIDWDRGGGGDKKQKWGQLRSDAANSLIRYFGSINSGSIGWCYGTPYQVGEYCKPEMAHVGQLPWLKPDHTARDVCP